MASLKLSLSLDNTRNIQSLLIGLEDARVRQGLMSQPKLPTDVHQLIGLIEDQKFLQMASNIVMDMRDLKQKNADRTSGAINDLPTLGAQLPMPQSIDSIREKGTELKTYIEGKYPDAVTLLRKYGEVSLARTNGLEYGYFSSNLDVAANAEAVVNAGVYTNVAVATMAVVAAAVVAVVGAVVV